MHFSSIRSAATSGCLYARAASWSEVACGHRARERHSTWSQSLVRAHRCACLVSLQLEKNAHEAAEALGPRGSENRAEDESAEPPDQKWPIPWTVHSCATAQPAVSA